MRQSVLPLVVEGKILLRNGGEALGGQQSMNSLSNREPHVWFAGRLFVDTLHSFEIFRSSALRVFPIFALSLLPSAGALANALGEEDRFPFETIHGVATAVSQDGFIEFERTVPGSLEAEMLTLKQRNVTRFSPDLIAAISGQELSCTVLLRTNQTVFVDCGALIGQRGNRQRLGLLQFQRVNDSDSIGCPDFEKLAFKIKGLEPCIFGEK